MKSTIKHGLLIIVLAIAGTFSGFAQRINLDKPMKAGHLTLFQELKNPKVWYYIIDKPKLATEKGKPKFSFIRCMENVHSAANEEEICEGGCGIVHAVVELEANEQQLEEAQTELEKKEPGALIMGPAVFKDENFAIISLFVAAGGDLSKQVLGFGKAPLLDGNRAAISLQLPKKGAEIIEKALKKTSDPDMSIFFEMKLKDYRKLIKDKDQR